jgi:hypothetical protein
MSVYSFDCSPGPERCNYAQDYLAMMEVVADLGRSPLGPKVLTMTPPPLMQQSSYGMNQTVINTVFPALVPAITQAAAAKAAVSGHAGTISGPIDIFTGMGGCPDWQLKFPKQCDLSSPWQQCAWWCDEQSCDQCHPNDDGYTKMASIVMKGLGFQTKSHFDTMVVL